MSLKIEGAAMGLNYGFDRLRFLTPVKVGSRVRLKGRVVEVVEKKPRHFLFKLDMTMEVEGEKKPALVAEWLNMFVME